MEISSQLQELLDAADERAEIAKDMSDPGCVTVVGSPASAIVQALEALRLEFRAATIAMLSQ